MMIPEIDAIEKKLLSLQNKRDEIMNLSREMIRLAGRSITMMHAKDMKNVTKLLKEMRMMSKKMKEIEKGDEYYSQQAHQEYAEAYSLYSILTRKRIPSAKEIGIADIPYLLGLLDVVGELKRESFESLRKNDYKTANAYYGFMVEIHDSLLPLRFSSSLVGDFRKKQDVARIQLESVSGELLSYGPKRKRG